MTDGPVRVAAVDERDLRVFGSLVEFHTLHDALPIANHRVGGTEATVSKDRAFADEETVWE